MDTMATLFPRVKTLQVARTCLCLHVQRAARALARYFDSVFRPLDLTQGQFSLLMALNRPQPPTVGELAPFLAMDRTTVTALLKPLQRRGWLEVVPDAEDRRKRRVRLTAEGHAVLRRAYPLWRHAHAQIERHLGDVSALRAMIGQMTSVPPQFHARRGRIAGTGGRAPSPSSRRRSSR
jgi:DNA-binding MarR family transcriptional regulator